MHGWAVVSQPVFTVQPGPAVDTYKSISAGRSFKIQPTNAVEALTIQLDDQTAPVAGYVAVSDDGTVPVS